MPLRTRRPSGRPRRGPSGRTPPGRSSSVDPVGDQRGQVQRPASTCAGQHGEVAVRVGRAVHAAAQGPGGVEDLQRVELHLSSLRADADDGHLRRRAGWTTRRRGWWPRGRRTRWRGRRPARRCSARISSDERSSAATQEVGGAGRARQLLLARRDVDGDDRRGAGRAGRPASTDRPDPAEADHHDRLAGARPGRCCGPRRTPVSTAQPSRAASVAGQAVGHRRGPALSGTTTSSANAPTPRPRCTVAAVEVLPCVDVPAAPCARRAQPRLAVRAEPARPARRRPVEHHVVAGRDPGDALADLDDRRRRPRGRAPAGTAARRVPLTRDRSEWQTPAAARAGPGPGRARARAGRSPRLAAGRADGGQDAGATT